MAMSLAACAWAKDTFGGVDLGDSRRTSRLVRMAALAADRPSGTVTAVYDDDADQQGAYDFLESEHVDAEVLEAGHGAAVAACCTGSRELLVVVDGSSLTFVDRAKKRELGSVGTYCSGARGLKVVTAYAVESTGVPVGPLCQTFWRRPARKPTHRGSAAKRPVKRKETQRWLDTIERSVERLGRDTPNTRATFLIDREGDSAAMLCTLARTDHDFVVRGNWDREVGDDVGHLRKLRHVLTYSKSLGSYELAVEARPKREARQAHIELTSVEVTVSLRDPVTKKAFDLRLWAVRAMEVGTCPADEQARSDSGAGQGAGPRIRLAVEGRGVSPRLEVGRLQRGAEPARERIRAAQVGHHPRCHRDSRRETQAQGAHGSRRSCYRGTFERRGPCTPALAAGNESSPWAYLFSANSDVAPGTSHGRRTRRLYRHFVRRAARIDHTRPRPIPTSRCGRHAPCDGLARDAMKGESSRGKASRSSCGDRSARRGHGARL
jgi:hypothetical protein